jgi:hypothetical protein
MQNAITTAVSITTAGSFNLVGEFYVSAFKLDDGASELMEELFNVLTSVISIAGAYFSLPLIGVGVFSKGFQNPTKAMQYISNGFINGGKISDKAGESES